MSEFRPSSELENIKASLRRATEAIAGDPHANPLEIFPNPANKERREDVEWGVDLSTEQEAAFRAAMAELGPGREESKGLDVTHLSNDMARRFGRTFNPNKYEWKAVLEGGQTHKVAAELELVLAEAITPAMIIPSGARDRRIGDKEKEKAAKLLGIEPNKVGDTEYDIVRQWFEGHPNFEPLEEEHVSPIKYKPNRYGISPVHPDEEKGQFVSIGTIKGIPVVLMRIDRFPDPDQPEKYPDRYIQPNNAQKMSYAAMLRGPDELDINIGFVTSATYQPSCELAANKVADEFGVPMTAQVLTYGTHQLAAVKGEVPVQPSLTQLGAEAYKTAKLLQQQK